MIKRLYEILENFLFGGKRFPPDLERHYRISCDAELQQRLRVPAVSVAVLVAIWVLSPALWKASELGSPTFGLAILSAIYLKLAFRHRPKRLYQMMLAIGTILYAGCIALIIRTIPAGSLGAVYAFAYLIAISNFLAPRLRVPEAIIGAGGAAVILFVACVSHSAHQLYSQNTALLLMNMISAVVFGVFVVFRSQFESRLRYRSDEIGKIQRRRADGIAESARMIAHDLRKGLFTLGAGIDPGLKKISDALEPLLFDMLLLGKVQTPRKETAQMSIIVEELADELRKRYPKSKVQEVRFPRRDDLTIAMAPDLLRRVFGNLLDNAYQAIDQSSEPSGRIWIARKEQDAKFVRILLGNTLSPAARPDLTRVLEPHYSHGKTKGTGLGLAIVQKIIVEAGGWISVRTSKLDAIEFVLSLPLGKSDQKQRKATMLKTKIHLFVVEDNPFIIEDWRLRCPQNMTSFLSAALFAEKLRAQSFDLDTQYLFVIDNQFDKEPDWSARRLVDIITEILPDAKILISSFVPTSIPWPHLPEKRGYEVNELLTILGET